MIKSCLAFSRRFVPTRFILTRFILSYSCPILFQHFTTPLSPPLLLQHILLFGLLQNFYSSPFYSPASPSTLFRSSTFRSFMFQSAIFHFELLVFAVEKKTNEFIFGVASFSAWKNYCWIKHTWSFCWCLA